MMHSLGFNKFQYGVGLMTVSNSVSERFGAVEVDFMFEQQRTDLFLRKEFSVAIVDGCYRWSCIQKLVDSGEPETNWASQPIRMTFIQAPGSQPLADREVLKHSLSANVMTRVSLQDTRFIAVIKSLVIYSKNFESR